MKYILDTHILLWFINGDNKLPNHFLEIIEISNNALYISFASLWETVIKINLSKLKMQMSLDELYRLLYNLNIKILEPNQNDLNILLNLENIHKDPFDRMIIAQSISNELIVLTVDTIFKQYKINLI